MSFYENSVFGYPLSASKQSFVVFINKKIEEGLAPHLIRPYVIVHVKWTETQAPWRLAFAPFDENQFGWY